MIAIIAGTMHLLQPIALLACAAVTSGAIHVARDPKQADFSIPTSNGTGGPAPARTNGTMPVTGELTMPKDAGKNCHGSHFCLSLLPPICKSAAARYLDNRTYTKRTSYVFSTDTKNYTGESFSGSGCTAIWGIAFNSLIITSAYPLR